MAFLVLFSTMSFSVNMHYCMGNLAEVSIFKSSNTCAMQMEGDHEVVICPITKKQCCEDETITFEGQDNLKVSFEKLSLAQQQFVVAYTYVYINLFEGLEQQVVPFDDYSPPLLVTDILLIDQTFLI